MTQDERFITLRELAEYLSVSEALIYKWSERQKIPGYKIGRVWRFKKSEMDDWIKTACKRSKKAA